MQKLPERDKAFLEDAGMILEHDLVVLTQDLPEQHLVSGDIGTVVHIHEIDKGYLVEFNTADGKAVGVLPLSPGQIRPMAPKEIYHVREVSV